MIPVRTSVEVDDIPGGVVALIVANLVVFVIQAGLSEALLQDFINRYGLVPARYGRGLDPTDLWPLLTNTFMHAGWLHLIVNMWTLWLFGGPLEARLGTARFVGFYLVCGALASLAHLAFNLGSTVPALGASGAIAGVLGGFALSYPRAKVHLLTLVLFFPVTWRLPAVAYTAIWFLFQIVPAVTEFVSPAPEGAGGIAWWAHIGGFIAGVGLITVIGTPKRATRMVGKPRPRRLEIGPQRMGAVAVGQGRPRFGSIGTGRRGAQRRATERRAAPPTMVEREARPATSRRRRTPGDALAAIQRAVTANLQREMAPQRTEQAPPAQSGPRRGPWG